MIQNVIINTAIILKFLYKYSDSEKPFISPFAAIHVLIDFSLQIDFYFSLSKNPSSASTASVVSIFHVMQTQNGECGLYGDERSYHIIYGLLIQRSSVTRNTWSYHEKLIQDVLSKPENESLKLWLFCLPKRDIGLSFSSWNETATLFRAQKRQIRPL